MPTVGKQDNMIKSEQKEVINKSRKAVKGVLYYLRYEWLKKTYQDLIYRSI